MLLMTLDVILLIGGLALTLIAFFSGQNLETNWAKFTPLSKWPRVSLGVGSLLMISASLWFAPQSSLSRDLSATQVALSSTQTAISNLPTSAPIVQTVVVTQPPLVLTRPDLPIAIDSQKSWQSTGLKVTQGEIVSIQVVAGKWSGWRRLSTGEFMWPENDGVGFTEECGGSPNKVRDCPVDEANITSLVGKIGLTKYAIGNDCTFQAASDGIVELSINDDGLSDNYGVLSVKIALVNTPDPLLSANCGFRNK
jgi:hypothetical protein